MVRQGWLTGNFRTKLSSKEAAAIESLKRLVNDEGKRRIRMRLKFSRSSGNSASHFGFEFRLR
jgi:hypothetical protein